MTPEIFKLPLDLSAEVVTNLIDKEPHVIENVTHTIFPLNHGIFYNHRLLLIHKETGEKLEFNKDYVLNYLHEEVTTRSGFGAYAVVIVINETLKGTIEVTYQAVGGEYSRLDDAILSAIEDINASESIVYWNNIRYKPLVYPPEPHLHDGRDIIGMDDVVEAIDEISEAIKGQHPEEIERLDKELATKVTNLNYVKYNQVDKNWTLTKDKPLRISATPYPYAVVIEIDMWRAGGGHVGLEVSGQLSSEGNWSNREYRITRGSVSNLEVQLFTVDGTSAEVLMRVDESSSASYAVMPGVVKYLKSRPEKTTLRCLDLDTITVPIPEEDYETPIPIWK